MIEYQLEAVVLDKVSANNADAYYILLTPNLGKIMARATSVRKLTSKLAGHLEPGTLSLVRIIRNPSGYYRLIEALAIRLPSDLREQKIIRLANSISPLESPDEDFFKAVKDVLLDELVLEKEKRILRAGGLDPNYATCTHCDSEKIVYFLNKDIIFMCQTCYLKRNPDGSGEGFLLSF